MSVLWEIYLQVLLSESDTQRLPNPHSSRMQGRVEAGVGVEMDLVVEDRMCTWRAVWVFILFSIPGL